MTHTWCESGPLGNFKTVDFFSECARWTTSHWPLGGWILRGDFSGFVVPSSEKCSPSHSSSCLVSFFPGRRGRVGQQPWQGSLGTDDQGGVQRSALLQILNCLYHSTSKFLHGSFNPSNGFFYGRSHLYRITKAQKTATKEQTNTNARLVYKREPRKSWTWHLPNYTNVLPLGRVCNSNVPFPSPGKLNGSLDGARLPILR